MEVNEANHMRPSIDYLLRACCSIEVSCHHLHFGRDSNTGLGKVCNDPITPAYWQPEFKGRQEKYCEMGYLLPCQ